MNCPNCGIGFKKIKTESLNPGFAVRLDQCPNCGGIWFDQFELYQIPSGEANKIDKLNKTLLAKSIAVKEELHCPRDKEVLSRLKDLNIPQDVFIMRCSKCGGNWLNKGELTEYKKELLEKQKKKPSPEAEKIVQEYLGGTDYSNTLVNIGNYLMSPIDPMTGSRLEDTSFRAYDLSSKEMQVLKKAPMEQKALLYKNFISQNKQGIMTEEKNTNNVMMGIMSVLKIILQLLIRLK